MKITKKYLLGFLLLTLVAIASFIIYLNLHPKKLPSYLIGGVGTVLGDEINLNTKYAARVKNIFIEDGSKIKKGEVLAVLDSKEYEIKKIEIQKSIEAKKAELKAKEIELEILKKTLFENVKKATLNLKVKKALVEEIQKSIDTLKNVVSQDEKDYKRVKNLYENRLVQKHKLENIELKLKKDENNLKSLYDKKYQAVLALKIAKSDLNQAKISLEKIKALSFSIKAMRSYIKSLQAKEDEILAIIKELVLRSPIDGFVTEKIANVGEVLAPGMSVANLIDPKTLYLKIFVDTLKEGKIKIGDRAVIFLDAYPNRAIASKVVRISQKAEFTPKEVAVRSDRIQKVYAVYIKPLKPDPLLKLGIEAIGIISLNKKGLPKSLKEIPPM